MVRLNLNFSRLDQEYIFSIIDKKLAELKIKLPGLTLINLGIGDISLPLSPSIAQAIQAATQEMSTVSGLRGYSPTYGYDFLRSAIAQVEYADLSISPFGELRNRVFRSGSEDRTPYSAACWIGP